jgi:signal transduction histidine kinase
LEAGIGMAAIFRREEQAKDNFVSLVSHELRTPLTAILGALSLVRAQATGQLPEKMRGMIDIADGNADRLLRIINDILDMEKIKSGKLDYDFRTLELGPLLEQAVAANQPYAEQFDVSIVLGPAPAVRVLADSGRLTQALTNLLSNGIKVSDAGGCIVLAMELGEDTVRISVIDRGPGIPAEMRSRIFEDFIQLGQAGGREKLGTGLGLGIAQSIIRDHRGVIDFVSQVGHGTTFFIDLPIVAHAPESQADQAAPSDASVSRTTSSASGG